jgi:hypothetical protein
MIDAALPPASALLEAMVAEMDALYDTIGLAGAPSATPSDFAPPAARSSSASPVRIRCARAASSASRRA